MQRARTRSRRFTAFLVSGLLATATAAEDAGRTFDFDGHRVYYVEAGEGVVLVCGYGPWWQSPRDLAVRS